MSTVPKLAPLLQAFFAQHLCLHKGASRQTLHAYRDAFRLLLSFLRDQSGKQPTDLKLIDLGTPVILAFLDHLENQRHNSPRTRNARLAAIRSFFRFAALQEPQCLDLATSVLSIPSKRATRTTIGYLTKPEIEAMLATPDCSCWHGRRNHALLLTLYNTGARVSEIAALQRSQVVLGRGAFIRLHGKGRKDRQVPLWQRTAQTLKTWFQHLGDVSTIWAFPNSNLQPLTRHGVAFVVKKAAKQAATLCPNLKEKTISPHVLRHTTAMHLLQAGIDLAVIALWLGHEQLETTHMYLEADLILKEQALDKLAPPGVTMSRFHADDALLSFLAAL